MTPESFATHALRPQDQVEAWREWYRPVFECVPEGPTGNGFPGETVLWKLGGLLISRTSAPAGRVMRTKHHLRHNPIDHWVISYSAHGAHFAKMGDTEVEVPARVPFLWSLGQELLYERTHLDRVQFFLARDAFRDIAPLLDAACGSALDTSLGGLLYDYMNALERRLTDVTEVDFPGITMAFGAVLAAALASSVERTVVAKPQIDLSRKERVRQVVHRHLRTPSLEPKTLSKLVGMSRSNLYRLFEDVGGVAQYIQHERLLEARDVLSDAAVTRSIWAIAEELCFADASSFSRVFKREFGYSPRAVRSAALTGLAPSPMPGRLAPPDQADFSALLRGL
jgi:AraC-like DNA-binding protein